MSLVEMIQLSQRYVDKLACMKQATMFYTVFTDITHDISIRFEQGLMTKVEADIFISFIIETVAHRSQGRGTFQAFVAKREVRMNYQSLAQLHLLAAEFSELPAG